MQSAKKIKLGDKEVTMRPPLVKDMRAVAHIETQEEKEIALIANLTGLDEGDIDDLTLKEYMKLQKALVGFTS